MSHPLIFSLKKYFILALFVLVLGGVNLCQAFSSGEIVITEIMLNPEVVSDTNGEWIELFNTTEESINLKNWRIEDEGTNVFVIPEDLIIAAKSYVVLGRNSDLSLNGGVEIDAVYNNFVLSNTEDEVILKDDEDNLIDDVRYNAIQGWEIKSGAALALLQTDLENSLCDFWQAAELVFGVGDKGTPGKKNFNFNQEPVFAPLNFQNFRPNQNNGFYVAASDENGDTLFYTLSVLQAEKELNQNDLGIIFKEVLFGDINQDGVVGFADYIAMRAFYGSKIGENNFNPYCDLNGDGRVSVIDLALVKRSFGQQNWVMFLSWTPLVEQVGEYLMQFEVRDNYWARAQVGIVLLVEDL